MSVTFSKCSSVRPWTNQRWLLCHVTGYPPITAHLGPGAGVVVEDEGGEVDVLGRDLGGVLLQQHVPDNTSQLALAILQLAKACYIIIFF